MAVAWRTQKDVVLIKADTVVNYADYRSVASRNSMYRRRKRVTTDVVTTITVAGRLEPPGFNRILTHATS